MPEQEDLACGSIPCLPVCALALLFALLPLHALRAADTAQPVALRHRFEAGTTNAFKIELEIKTDGSTSKLQGTLLAVTTAADAEVATVSLTASLRPQAGERAMPPSFGASWNPFEFRPYGYAPQLGCQAEVDSRGQVLREMGELNLPPPFNEIYRFLFARFPETPSTEWEAQSEQTLPADVWGNRRVPPWYYGPAGPGSRAPARMAASRREKYQLLSVNEGVARCRWELTIDSYARVANGPRWQITATGEMQFQSESGSLQGLEMQCTAAWSTETLVRRAPMVLRCQRVPVQQLETLLAAAAPKPPETLSETDVRRLLAELDSGDSERSFKAANTLMTANVSSVSSDLLALLAERIGTTENHAQSAIVRLFTLYATPQHVPRLLGLLKTSDIPARTEAIQALGRLKEKRASEPLAEMVARGSDYGSAEEALKQIGPPAEEAVLRLLQEKHLETRRRACEILQRIGTRRSLEPLREVVLASDETLGNAARQAVQEIQARLETESQERP